MVDTLQRAGSVGPALIRLLARLTDLDAVDAGVPPSQRLAGWLAWTDAISLARVLDGEIAPAAAAPDAAASQRCERVRASLVQAVASDDLLGESPAQAGSADPGSQAPAQYEPYRERYLLLQRTMAARIGTERARLRATLAAQGGAKARLAAVDAILEQALAPRERALLGGIATLLQGRFERLQRDAGQSDAWLAVFRRDARSVLLAELDVRFQPVAGLSEVLAGR